MRAEKFFLFFSCVLVIELFIVALILAVFCFMSLLLRHYYQYFAIVISSAVIPSSL